jgi:hypothetical protein
MRFSRHPIDRRVISTYTLSPRGQRKHVGLRLHPLAMIYRWYIDDIIERAEVAVVEVLRSLKLFFFGPAKHHVTTVCPSPPQLPSGACIIMHSAGTYSTYPICLPLPPHFREF